MKLTEIELRNTTKEEIYTCIKNLRDFTLRLFKEGKKDLHLFYTWEDSYCKNPTFVLVDRFDALFGFIPNYETSIVWLNDDENEGEFVTLDWITNKLWTMIEKKYYKKYSALALLNEAMQMGFNRDDALKSIDAALDEELGYENRKSLDEEILSDELYNTIKLSFKSEKDEKKCQ